MDCEPRWSFAVLDLFGKFGWGLLAKESLEELLGRLRSFETMTWKEILVDGRKQNHSIKVEVCSPEALKRLQVLGLDDVDELVSLRVKGAPRVIGILDRNIFKILWWDPDHQVCPSRLKGT